MSPEQATAFQQELGRLLAADVLWMAQRIDLPLAHPASEIRIADGRYTRMLRFMADLWLTSLEAEKGES